MNPKLRSDQTKSLPSLVCPHFFKPRPIALALSALLLCTAHSQAGEVVRYPVPDSTLRTVGLGHTDSLAPANLEQVSGTISINQDRTGIGDENSVRVDQEMVKLSQNQILYEAAVTMLNKKLSMLKYAANGGA